jgi:uncharacterized protein (TIGR02145 family)
MMKIDRFVLLILTPLLFTAATSLTHYTKPEDQEPRAVASTPTAVPLKSVKIGSQEWTTENLDVSTFLNGDPIPQANNDAAWEKACIEGTAAWCYYNNDPKNKSYGKLYNYWAIYDKRKLIPDGWHIPTDAEWATLAESLGGEAIAGKRMKSVKGWKQDGNGDNKSGFNGLAGGYRSHEQTSYYGGPFFGMGSGGYWWTKTRYLVDNSYCRVLSSKGDKLEKDSFVITAGLSIRLVKD